MNTFFNPGIYLGLAGLALIIGLVATGSTGGLMVFLPALIFLGLYAFSVLRRVKIRHATRKPTREELGLHR